MALRTSLPVVAIAIYKNNLDRFLVQVNTHQPPPYCVCTGALWRLNR